MDAFQQMIEAQGDSQDGQLPQCLEQGRGTIGAFLVQAERCKGAFAKAILDQTAQCLPGAHLQKEAHIVGIHGLDGLLETYRLGQLSGQGFTNGCWIIGVGGCRGIPIDRQARRSH